MNSKNKSVNFHKSIVRFTIPDEEANESNLWPLTEPATPTISEQASQLKRTFSFDNLYKISSTKESRKQLQTQVLSSVWRPRNQKSRNPQDFERLLVYATRGAARTFALTFSMRALLNLVLVFVSIFKTRKFKLGSIRHALFGQEPLRFGLQFGIFVWLWRFCYHSLKFIDPSDDGRHKRRHSWIAGAISSFGALVELRKNRLALGQQLTVRGLHGMYRSIRARNWISIPHGEFVIFGLACSQIMYAWIMSPDTIPKAYNDWIQQASKVPSEAIPIHRQLVRTGKFNIEPVLSTIKNYKTTPKNKLRLHKIVQDAQNGQYGLHYLPPAILHPWIEGLCPATIERFYLIFFDILPVYASLHFIPALILKRKQFKKDAADAILRTTFSSLRSSAFLATFVIIYHTWFSAKHAIYRIYRKNLPDWLSNFLISKQSLWFGGLLTCASLLVEEPKRRSELALYVLPKAMESAWTIARRRRWVPHIPCGPEILTAFGTASLMQAYVHEPYVLSKLVYTVLYQFIGNIN